MKHCACLILALALLVSMMGCGMAGEITDAKTQIGILKAKMLLDNQKEG